MTVSHLTTIIFAILYMYESYQNWQANILLDNIKRLEQENKALKDNNNHLKAIIDDGRAENKRFREENKELKEKLDKEEYNACCECTNIQNQNDNYRSALEEIRENLVKLKTNDEDDFTYEYSKIEDKINEVLQCE